MTLRELAVACYIYKILAKNIKNKDPYEQFRQSTEGSPDLCKQEHRKALLEFLNKYGCRHINKDSHKKIAPNKIFGWYKEYRGKLPKEEEKLWELEDEKLESFDKLHSTLSKLVVARRRDKVEVHMGPVGAAKMLFAIRPNVFPPWDNAIWKELKKKYSVEFYADYLKHVKKNVLELKEICKKEGFNLTALPKKVKRPKSTVAKLIDEYYWITITKGFEVKEIVGCWNKWTKS